MIDKTPIFVDLDRRREVVFNVNTEIRIRNAGGKDASIWETIGTRENAETGEQEAIYDVNLENLRLYLWATIYADAARAGEMLTVEDVGELLTERRWVTLALVAVQRALKRYYGDSIGGDAKGEA